MTTAPRLTAADIAAAATRLAGTVVLDLAGIVTGPAVYLARLEAFASVDDTTELLGPDDGSLIDLLDGVTARELVELHGTPGRAAAAVNARLRAEWRLA